MANDIEAGLPETGDGIEKVAVVEGVISDKASSNVNSDDKAFYKVAWAESDPHNPLNWNGRYKAWLAFQLAMLSFVGSFGASIISPAQGQLAAYLDLGNNTTVLAVSLYVLGFAFGSMLWAPLAEVHGRKVSILPPMLVSALFEIGTATSETAAAVFATRFLAGVFASASISNTAAAIGDFYSPKSRGVPMALMSICIVGGPCLAPLVGAAITVNPNMGWRCASKLCMGFMGTY